MMIDAAKLQCTELMGWALGKAIQAKLKAQEGAEWLRVSAQHEMEGPCPSQRRMEEAEELLQEAEEAIEDFWARGGSDELGEHKGNFPLLEEMIAEARGILAQTGGIRR